MEKKTAEKANENEVLEKKRLIRILQEKNFITNYFLVYKPFENGANFSLRFLLSQKNLFISWKFLIRY